MKHAQLLVTRQVYANSLVALEALAAIPRANSIVVCDNAAYFKDLRFKAMIAATGAKLMNLDPHAKHENPIEEAFSKVKANLLRNIELTHRNPTQALHAAFESITEADAVGYRHAGFQIAAIDIIPGILTVYEDAHQQAV